MNETIPAEEAMGGVSIEEALLTIGKQMMRLRPRARITLRPFTKGISHQDAVQGPYTIDLSQAELKEGECAYISTNLYASSDSEIMISVRGNVRVWLQGQELLHAYHGLVKEGKAEKSDKWYRVRCSVRQGENALVLKTVKENREPVIQICCSFYRYPNRWANDYLLHLRPLLPLEGMQQEEGFALSRAICYGALPAEQAMAMDDLEKARDIVAPKVISYQGDVNFSRFYQPNKKKGGLAYAYSVAAEKGILKIEARSPLVTFIRGKKTGEAKKGDVLLLKVEAGDPILIKSLFTHEGWGFECSGTELNALPEEKESQDQWLCSGVYYGSFNTPLPPEYGVQFKRPYFSGSKEGVFWRCNRENTYIRLYLNSVFYGQWFYGAMVGLYGLKMCADALKKEEWFAYYTDSLEIMTDYYEYIKYDEKQFGNPQIIARAAKLNTWDDIGTIGMNFCELYEMTSRQEVWNMILRLAERIDTILRLQDGTFYRGSTIWADDFYMSTSFLVRLVKLTGKTDYRRMLLQQIQGIKKWLWMEDKQLFSHIYFIQQQRQNRVAWGRGNGWIFLALSEILLMTEDEEIYRESLELFQQHAKGIAACVDEIGMWHQVLTRRESYAETSCSAMFTLAIARGVRCGWLGKEYRKLAESGWRALMQHCVDKQGNTYGVCLGSGCQMEEEYYFTIPTHKNDDHGTGILLAAGCEILKMRQWQAE